MNEKYIKGVVEGFYGKPWTWQERMDILSYLEGQYNLYIYAPKEDKYHRELWRQKYPEAFMKQFEKLVQHGKKKKIDVSLALSPGLSLVYSNEKDLNTLCNKFKAFADMGVTTFSLFFDDIPEQLVHTSDIDQFNSLADAQSSFTNTVYKRLSKQIENLTFIMCPTLYFGETVNHYHYELGEKILSDIEIMWTGHQVCSTLLETKEAEKISKTFQRPVLYWDNYPVNDASMAPELHIGPYTGREGGLYKCSSGIILNPMSRAYASLIALYSAGEYFEKKEQFNPIESWKKAIKKIAPNSYQAFQEFAEVNMKSPLSSNPSKHIQTILQHYFDLYSAQKKEDAAKHLINTGKKITSNADIIKNDIHPNLFTDIQIWLHEYRYWGETLSLIGQVILADLSMYREDTSQKKLDEVTAKNKQLEERLKRAVSFHTTVFGNELFSFALDRLRISKGLVSMYRY